MTEKIVKVLDEEYRITIQRQSKKRWLAAGEYMGKAIQVEGSGASAAAKAWHDAAFGEHLAQIFIEKIDKFFSLFVAAKTKTFQTVLARIKAGQNIDPAFGTALLFEEECALLQAINVLPIHNMLQTRGDLRRFGFISFFAMICFIGASRASTLRGPRAACIERHLLEAGSWSMAVCSTASI
jgi:hypothetical protein